MPEKIEETPLRRVSREAGDAGLFPPQVHQLFEAGKARKAQAALRAHIPKELNTGRKRRQQQVLDDVYLWLEPLDKAPTMYTLNGVGTALYGNYKPNADGVHIATLWFVVVFVPFFPLAAYVVRKAGSNRWTFYAKAPLPPFARIWRLGFAGLAVAAAVAIGARFAWDRSHAEVWVYNGFDVPVEVTLGDDHLALAPHELERAGGYPLGTLAVTATPDGWAVPLEQGEVDLAALGDDELLYNVAGRASLVRSWVVYGPGASMDDVLLGSPAWLGVGSVDYLLRDPPQSKEVREGNSIIDEVIYNAEDEVPFSVAAVFTQSMVGAEDAWRMERARLAVHPDDREALALITSMKRPGDPELVTVADLARRGRPDQVEAHRLYQNCAQGEQAVAVREEYAALAAEHPDSPMYRYLAGRLLEDGSPDAEAQFRKALELDPEFAYAHLALGYQLASQGALGEAIQAYARYADSGDAAFADVLRSRIRLLQVQAEPGWMEGVEAILDQGKQRLGTDLGLAGLRAVMAVRHGRASLDRALQDLETDATQFVDDPAAVASNLVPARLDALLAADDLGGAQQLLQGLDPEQDAWVLAKGELFLALAAGDPDAIGQALDAYGELYASAATTQALYAAAAAQALGHPGAAGLVEVARTMERPGSVGPAVVLAQDAALDSPASLDALLKAVPLDARGMGYTAAAILLQHGGGAPAVLAHARAQAARLALPDELPPWR